jgi:hypothetical protein
MPSDSDVHMARKSAYVNNELFFHSAPKITSPKETNMGSIAFLDRHSTHSSSKATEFAEKIIIMLCLLSHIIHYLQPLARSFFKLLKTHYEAARRWMNSNPERKISWLSFGEFLKDGWEKMPTLASR